MKKTAADGINMAAYIVLGGVAGPKQSAGAVTTAEGGAKGISPIVTAEGKIGDTAFTDVNQTARPIAQANPDEPTLIADRVATKIEATGNLYRT